MAMYGLFVMSGSHLHAYNVSKPLKPDRSLLGATCPFAILFTVLHCLANHSFRDSVMVI